jgi:D-alanyl-D-alanine carboxypeptidase
VKFFERLRKGILASLLLASIAHAPAAQSYLVVDNQTGLILEAKNGNEKLQVASLTKIATAIVSLIGHSLPRT